MILRKHYNISTYSCSGNCNETAQKCTKIIQIVSNWFRVNNMVANLWKFKIKFLYDTIKLMIDDKCLSDQKGLKLLGITIDD